jgi:hypothetical protein
MLTQPRQRVWQKMHLASRSPFLLYTNLYLGGGLSLVLVALVVCMCELSPQR